MKNLILILALVTVFDACIDQYEEKTYADTVIIGGGLMGSASGWQLARQGSAVLLLEKQDSIYTYGSSYGQARIARSNNRGSDIWSYLHNQSVKETQHLIDFLNSTSSGEPYQMEDLYTTSPVTYVGRVSILEKLLASLIRQKVNYELAVDATEGLSKFGVKLADSVLMQREYNLFSGTLNPQRLIHYLHQGIRHKGGTVKYQTEVEKIKYNQESDVYELEIRYMSGKSQLLVANKVVCPAGPYNGSLLEEIAPYFDTLINPQRVFLTFLRIGKEKYQSLTEVQKQKIFSFYPVINSAAGTREGSFFSMIEYLDEENIPIIKIGGHFQRSEIQALDQVWQEKLTSSEIEWSINRTSEYFQLLDLPITPDDLEYVNGYSCVYSLTKSEVPFVTPITGLGQNPNHKVIVVGGMSGVGAKGAMTYGLITANLLSQRTSTDSMYQVVEKAVGFARLVDDLGL